MAILRAENRKWCLVAILFLTASAAASGGVELGIGLLEESDYLMLRGNHVGVSPGRVVTSWKSNEQQFRRAKAPYLLY